jgi:hypothetical protein
MLAPTERRVPRNQLSDLWSELVELLIGALKKGEQVYESLCQRLKKIHQDMRGNDDFDDAMLEQMIDSETDSAIASYTDSLHATRDKFKEKVRNLPQQLRKQAVAFFVASIDLLKKFQRTVADYIYGFLGKAWSVLKDIAACITRVAEQTIEAIRSIFSSGSGRAGNRGGFIHLKECCECARSAALFNWLTD